MTARYVYSHCPCCPDHLVLDTEAHTVVGVADSAWDGTVVADRLNRGDTLRWTEPPLPARKLRAVFAGLLLGYGTLVAVAAVLSVFG